MTLPSFQHFPPVSHKTAIFDGTYDLAILLPQKHTVLTKACQTSSEKDIAYALHDIHMYLLSLQGVNNWITFATHSNLMLWQKIVDARVTMWIELLNNRYDND
jgi:hypothetical protein